MHHSKIVAIAAAASLLSACTEPGGEPGRGVENGGSLSKKDVGIGAGAIAGGVLGSAIGGGAGRTVAIIGGTLLGGMLGSNIGSSMDNADRAEYDRVTQNAMETGSYQTWQHGDHHGTIRPEDSYQSADGHYCREYTQTIYVGDRAHEGHGTACREDDGSWQIAD